MLSGYFAYAPPHSFDEPFSTKYGTLPLGLVKPLQLLLITKRVIVMSDHPAIFPPKTKT
jgi:hypothetical protein